MAADPADLTRPILCVLSYTYGPVGAPHYFIGAEAWWIDADDGHGDNQLSRKIYELRRDLEKDGYELRESLYTETPYEKVEVAHAR